MPCSPTRPRLLRTTSPPPPRLRPPRSSLSFPPLLFRAEPITETANRMDQPRATLLLELLPNPRDMYLERVRLGARRDRPHRLRQLRVGDELSAAPHQRRQDAELNPGQRQLPPAAPCPSLAEVDDHVAGREFRAAFAAMPADHGLNPSHQLFEGEWLGQVVVRAHLQAGDPVADRRAGADSHESGVRLRAEGFEELRTFVVWEHQVEEHDVRIPLPDKVEPAAGRLNRPDGVAFLSQPGGDRPRQAPVVLHQGDFPLDGHADGILPWNLRSSWRCAVTAEFRSAFVTSVGGTR